MLQDCRQACDGVFTGVVIDQDDRDIIGGICTYRGHRLRCIPGSKAAVSGGQLYYIIRSRGIVPEHADDAFCAWLHINRLHILFAAVFLR